MDFFIPHLKDDPTAAEAEWQRYLRASSAPAASRRVYTVTYMHEGDRFVVRVGEPRKQHRRKTGPRGGYIKNAEPDRFGSHTGTDVSGIIDTGDLLYVWSYGPPSVSYTHLTLPTNREV